MKGYKLFARFLCLLLFVAVLPNAMADQWNQATKLTFSVHRSKFLTLCCPPARIGCR